MTKIKKFFKSALSFFGVTVILAVIFASGFFIGRHNAKNAIKPEKTVETVVVEKPIDIKVPAEVEKRRVSKEEVDSVLVCIQEFAAYSSNYTSSKTSEHTRYIGDITPIPFTTNTISVECEGTVKVGYDTSKVIAVIDNDYQKIYFTLPEPKVLDNYIIWDSIKYNEENCILNPIDFGQYQTMLSQMKEEGLKKAVENGIFEEAEKNFKLTIESFFSGFEDFEVIFVN